MSVRVTRKQAQQIMAVCIAVPALAFAARIVTSDRTDPYDAYKRMEGKEVLPPEVPPPDPVAADSLLQQK